jgi:chorismate mutase
MASMRGIRGAITVEADEPELILSATRELLEELLRANGLTDYDEVISAIFTTTSDLKSTFPAEAARRMGMGQVPLLCAQEIPVPGSMARCIRVLIHAHTDRKPSEIRHVYLRDAQKLRPDMQSAQ